MGWVLGLIAVVCFGAAYAIGRKPVFAALAVIWLIISLMALRRWRARA